MDDLEISFYCDNEAVDWPHLPHCSPPDIPPFSPSVNISDLPVELLRKVAMALDMPACGALMYNWEKLATFLGVNQTEIQYMSNRVHFPQSPALVLLFQKGATPLSQLLSLLISKDKLYRWDILHNIKVDLFAFSKSCVVRIPAVPSNSHVSNIFPDVPCTSNAQDFPVTSSASVSNDNSKARILISWFPEDDKHKNYVRWLTKNLKQYGAEVKRDDHFLATSQGNNIINYLQFYSKADTVLVVLSKHYSRCCGGDIGSFGVLNSDKDMLEERAKLIQFLHIHMQMEIFRKMAVLERFRVVKFASLPFLCVPPILTGNIVFEWPTNQKQLFTAIFDKFKLKNGYCKFESVQWDNVSQTSNTTM